MKHNKFRSPSTSQNSRSNPVYFCTPIQAKTLLSEGRELLLFVRHGLTDWNVQMRLQGREEVPLNDLGKEQAEELASLLRRIGFKGSIYASPLSRAKDTATIISEKLELPDPIVLESLIERDYSSLSGLTMAERRERFPSPKDYPSDIESVTSAALRMKKVALELCLSSDGSADKITVAVTHGGVINSLFSYLTRGRVGMGKHVAKNCTVSAVASGPADIIPLAFNLHGEAFADYVNGIDQNISKKENN